MAEVKTPIKKNISGLQFPGDDNIYVLNAETTTAFDSAHANIPADAAAVGTNLSNLDIKIITEIKDRKNALNTLEQTIDSTKANSTEVLKLDGTNAMIQDLNMGNNSIINVADLNPESPTNSATNKKYVDEATSEINKTIQGINKTVEGHTTSLSNLDTKITTETNNREQALTTLEKTVNTKANSTEVLKLNGTKAMTNILNMDNHKIIGVTSPSNSSDAANKNYVDNAKNIIQYINPPISQSFISDGESTEFPYAAKLPLNGVTKKDYVIVNFTFDQLNEGIYAPFCRCGYDNFVYIYASKQSSPITVDNVIVIPGKNILEKN